LKRNPYLPGDPEKFILENINLARSVAWTFIKPANRNSLIKFDDDDFFSIAYIGLIKAYNKFNPDKFRTKDGEPVQFSSYAIPMIRGEIWRHTRDYGYAIRKREGLKVPVDSLDRIVNESENNPIALGDTAILEVPDNYDQVIISDFLDKLNPRLQKLYELRFVRELSQTQIAGIFGISQVQVSRLEKNLLELAGKYGRGEEIQTHGKELKKAG
jgi:RNA polymerase sporulation-specific sigma factor